MLKGCSKTSRQVRQEFSRKATIIYHMLIIAYEVLSDADKRRKYDQCGEECVSQPEQQGGGMNPFGDIFGDIFGGGGQ